MLETERASKENKEFESLQTHFEKYLHDLNQALGSTIHNHKHLNASSTATPAPRKGPSRHTAAAAQAAKIAARKVSDSRFLARPVDRIKPKKPEILPAPKSEDPPEYEAVHSWKKDNEQFLGDMDPDEQEGHSREKALVANARRFNGVDQKVVGNIGSPANLTSTWNDPFPSNRDLRSLKPERVPLRGKIAKRCIACNNTMMRPESKPSSLRYRIKVPASSYIPAVELGNRRRLIERGAAGENPQMSSTSTLGKGTSEIREEMHLPLVRTVGVSFNICIAH